MMVAGNGLDLYFGAVSRDGHSFGPHTALIMIGRQEQHTKRSAFVPEEVQNSALETNQRHATAMHTQLRDRYFHDSQSD